MNTRKRRIVFVLLLAFALWPLVHHALVRSLDLNPWKYGGWAMYTVPVISPEIALFVVREGARDAAFEPLLGTDLDAQSRSQMFLLLTRLSSERRGASTDPLGRALLAGVEGAQKVRIQIRSGFIDPDTALVGVEQVDHDYAR